MRHSLAVLFLVLGGLSLAASANSQSLAEAAKKEKARRAKNAANLKDKQVVVIDDHALRNAEASTFSAVQVSGAPSQARKPVELGRPVPENPNRTRPAASQQKETKSGSTTSSSPRIAETELGRGWSTGKDNTTQMREAPPGTKPIHPTTPRTMVGRDRNGNPIYR